MKKLVEIAQGVGLMSLAVGGWVAALLVLILAYTAAIALPIITVLWAVKYFFF